MSDDCTITLETRDLSRDHKCYQCGDTTRIGFKVDGGGEVIGPHAVCKSCLGHVRATLKEAVRQDQEEEDPK